MSFLSSRFVTVALLALIALALSPGRAAATTFTQTNGGHSYTAAHQRAALVFGRHQRGTGAGATW